MFQDLWYSWNSSMSKYMLSVVANDYYVIIMLNCYMTQKWTISLSSVSLTMAALRLLSSTIVVLLWSFSKKWHNQLPSRACFFGRIHEKDYWIQISNNLEIVPLDDRENFHCTNWKADVFIHIANSIWWRAGVDCMEWANGGL